MVILKESFSGWQSNYKGHLKSSWTGSSAQLLCTERHNNIALPPVHEPFKQPSQNITLS